MKLIRLAGASTPRRSTNANVPDASATSHRTTVNTVRARTVPRRRRCASGVVIHPSNQLASVTSRQPILFRATVLAPV